MANIVLAGSALLNFFRNGSAADTVESILLRAEQGKDRAYLHGVSWGEAYFGALKSSGEAAAERMRSELRAMPIEIVADDPGLVISRLAMHLRSDFGLSADDCYAAALSKMKKAELVSCSAEASKLEKEIKVRTLAKS